MEWQKDIANSVFSMHISNKITDDNLLNPKRPLIFVPGTRTSRLALEKKKVLWNTFGH